MSHNANSGRALGDIASQTTKMGIGGLGAQTKVNEKLQQSVRNLAHTEEHEG